LYLGDVGYRRRIQSQFWIGVFVIHIVSHSNEFSIFVGASEQNHCDLEQVFLRYLGSIWWVYLEDELVDTRLDRTQQNRIQYLVICFTLSRAHIDNFPFKIFLQFTSAFKGDFKLKGVGEGGRVVEDLHVRDINTTHLLPC